MHFHKFREIRTRANGKYNEKYKYKTHKKIN